MPSGIDIRPSNKDPLFEEELRDTSGNRLNTGTCDVRVYKRVTSGASTPLTVTQTYLDYADLAFRASPADHLEAATYQGPGPGSYNTGLWTIGFKASQLTEANGWTIGDTFIVEFVHSTGVVAKQIFQWGDKVQF